MRRRTFFDEINEIDKFQDMIDIIPEDALESPA